MVVVGNWHLKEELGAGSFAKVRLATHKTTKQQAAVKVQPKADLTEAAKTQIRREIAYLKQLENPYICRMYEVLETARHVYVVLEYVDGGDFADYLREHGPLSEDASRHFFRQLCEGMAYCHKSGIVHRDLKPANILLSNIDVPEPLPGMPKLPTVKITDFGLANRLAGTDQQQKLETVCGTPAFVAPEVLRSQTSDGYDGPPVDVWSAGVMLYHMLTNQLPFSPKDRNEVQAIFKKVLSGIYEPLPSSLSPGVRSLVDAMLRSDPTQRITMDEILDHPWLAPLKGTPAPPAARAPPTG